MRISKRRWWAMKRRELPAFRRLPKGWKAVVKRAPHPSPAFAGIDVWHLEVWPDYCHSLRAYLGPKALREAPAVTFLRSFPVETSFDGGVFTLPDYLR